MVTECLLDLNNSGAGEGVDPKCDGSVNELVFDSKGDAVGSLKLTTSVLNINAKKTCGDAKVAFEGETLPSACYKAGQPVKVQFQLDLASCAKLHYVAITGALYK